MQHGLKITNVRPGSHPSLVYVDFDRFKDTGNLALTMPPKPIYIENNETIETHKDNVIELVTGSLLMCGCSRGNWGELTPVYFGGHELSDGSFNAWVRTTDIIDLPPPIVIEISPAMQLKLQAELDKALTEIPKYNTFGGSNKIYEEMMDIHIRVSLKTKEIVGHELLLGPVIKNKESV